MSKIRVQGMGSNLARTAAARFPGEMQYVSGLPCEAVVHLEQAYMCYGSGYGSDGSTHRPYLRMVGQVSELRGEFPGGITEVAFNGKAADGRVVDDDIYCPRVDYQYQFSDEELAALCLKGLFNEGFEAPVWFSGQETSFELPLTCECSMLPPETKEDVPLLFVSIEKPYLLETDGYHSGYNLTEYFTAPEKQEQKPLQYMSFDYDRFMDEDKTAAKEQSHMEQEPQADQPEWMRTALSNIDYRVRDEIRRRGARHILVNGTPVVAGQDAAQEVPVETFAVDEEKDVSQDASVEQDVPVVSAFVDPNTSVATEAEPNEAESEPVAEEPDFFEADEPDVVPFVPDKPEEKADRSRDLERFAALVANEAADTKELGD